MQIHGLRESEAVVPGGIASGIERKRRWARYSAWDVNGEELEEPTDPVASYRSVRLLSRSIYWTRR